LNRQSQFFQSVRFPDEGSRSRRLNFFTGSGLRVSADDDGFLKRIDVEEKPILHTGHYFYDDFYCSNWFVIQVNPIPCTRFVFDMSAECPYSFYHISFLKE